MQYNFDFCIASLVIHSVFFFFFILQNRFPIRQNRAFFMLMIIETLTIVSDIASSYADSLWQNYSTAYLWFINTAYFACYIARFMAFFEYAAAVSVKVYFTSWKKRLLIAAPFLISEYLILTSFMTGAVFTIRPDAGYARGPRYDLLYWTALFYIILSALVGVVYRNKSSWIERLGIYSSCALLLTGLSLRRTFSNVLILDAFAELSIVIIYLTMQNPQFFRSQISELFNLQAFRRLTSEWMSTGRPFSILAFGIDQYDINRSVYGIPQMEEGLELIGKWITKTFPDMYGFYLSHGRFVLLYEKEKDLCEIRKKIEDRFAQRWNKKDTDIYLNVTISFMNPVRGIDSNETLLNAINLSLLTKKGEKICGMYEISEEMIAGMKRVADIQQATESAVRDNTIEVWYQPVYSASEHKITGAEALARLFDPVLGFIPPDEFIIQAEQNGMIYRLGLQIFEKTCRFINSVPLEENGIQFINVNLSPIQCMNEHLSEDLVQITHNCSTDMGLVNFEITETAAADTAFLRSQMFLLIQNGASFSLDDFGTGFTNLSRLVELPLKVAKIDKSIVWAYFRKENRILEDVIPMFRNQNLKIVAEGVETKEMADTLIEMGCDYLQGFYFAKPLPEKEFLTFLRTSKDKELLA